MIALTLQQIARSLGGEVNGGQVLAPAPGHGPSDRGLCVRLDPSAPDGFLVHLFNGGDPVAAKDYVREKCGLPPFTPNGQGKPAQIISYDYRDPASGGIRYRKIRRDYTDGSKNFYFEKPSRNAGPALLYGGDRVADLSEGQPVWIVEGEKCVDRMRELGAVAISGDTGHQSKLSPAHVELLRGLPVILWPDSDEPGEIYITNAAAAIRTAYQAADIRVVRPFAVDGLQDGSKRDVCDWAGGEAALAKLATSAVPYAPLPAGNGKAPMPRFDLIPFDKITFDATPAYHVKNLLCSTGLVVVWGPPKCGKSFWVFDLVMHVALGWEYRGRRVRQGTVVYCALEGCAAFKNRIEAFRQKHLAEESGEVPFYLMASPMSLVTDHAALIASIRAALGAQPPAIVVIDTLNRSLAGSESSDEDMSKYIQAADAIRDAFNCAVVIIHHCGHEGTRPRGHSSLMGALDVQIGVVRDAANNIVATVELMKDGQEGDQITSRLEVVELGEDEDGDKITSCVIVPVEGTTPMRKTAGPKLTKGAKIALAAIHEAIGECGTIPPASNHIPAGVKAVTQDQWRDYAYRPTG